jgi:hypothetical protein
MTAAQTSVIVTLRERVNCAFDVLRTLLARTPPEVEIVYSIGGASDAHVASLRKALSVRRHTFLASPDFMPQNLARNLGAKAASPDSAYFVFIDNDVIVDDGWLDPLLKCMSETGAGIVGPLVFEGRPEDRIVHAAGGVYTEVQTRAGRVAFERHIYGHMPLNALSGKLSLRDVDYVEGHCFMASRAAFEVCGGFDERLITMAEYVDICQRVRDAGYRVLMEPSSAVTYIALGSLTAEDMPLFFQRWDIADTQTTYDYYIAKRGLRPDCEFVTYGLDFVRGWRASQRVFDPAAEWHSPVNGHPTPAVPTAYQSLLQLIEDLGYSVSAFAALKAFLAPLETVRQGREMHSTPGGASGLRAGALLAADSASVSLIAAALIYPLLRGGILSGERAGEMVQAAQDRFELADLRDLLNALVALEKSPQKVFSADFAAEPVLTVRAGAVLTALIGANRQNGLRLQADAFLTYLQALGFANVAGAAKSSLALAA